MATESVELLSLLYELSLTNLKHNDTEDIARKFIKKFLSRKSIEYGAIWLIKSSITGHLKLQKLYAMPHLADEVEVDQEKILHAFGEQSFIITDHSLFGLDLPEGAYAYFRLGEFGYLEFFSRKGADKINESAFRPFEDVIFQLARSLESGISYSRLEQEIEQRKLAENSLRHSEEKYRRIIDNIKLGLLEVDNDERIQYANKPFLDLVQYELKDILNKKASDLFISDDARNKMDEQHALRKEGHSSSYEVEIRDSQGHKKWAIISGAPNYDQDNQIIGSIGIHLDVTSEKKLIEEKEFKDTQLKKLFESSLDALISIDENGAIFEWSPQAEKVFQYTSEEIKGKKLSDTIIPHQYRKSHDDGMTNYIKTGHGPVLNSRIEITGLKKNGEEFPIELTIFPMKFEERHYFTAFVRDISEIKASKENMEKALKRQQELNDLKSQFISMTSHELRTPLTTIRTNTELMRYQIDQEAQEQEPKIYKNINRIETNVERLNQLINNILMIGQLDSKKVPFSPESIDVEAFVTKHVLSDFKARDHTVPFHVYGDPRVISLDKRLFTHIMSNLVENAIKYSRGKQSPEIHVHYLDNALRVDVQDFGIGIPEKDREKLFTTFFRASNVGNIQGTGLGLSIVKEFVKIHDGEIKVVTEVGKGTTFSLFFPQH